MVNTIKEPLLNKDLKTIENLEKIGISLNKQVKSSKIERSLLKSPWITQNQDLNKAII